MTRAIQLRLSYVFVLACALSLMLTGCFESKQDFTVNPDGSGKVVLDVLFDPSAISMGEKKDPQREMESAVRKIVQQAKGIEVWKDVSYKRMPDGRVSFKGTAYFQDLNKVKIENYGTQFKLSREGKVLTLEMVEDSDKKKPSAGVSAASAPQTDEEIEAEIEKAKGEWERSKPLMMSMLSGLKKEATVRLPGKLLEVNNFTRVSDNVVNVTLDGAKLLEAMDSAMSDVEWMRAQAKTGSLAAEGPPMDESMNEKYFGNAGPLVAKAQVGSKTLFDYKKETAAANKAYPKLLESLGVVTKLPPGSVLNEGIRFSAGEIKDTRTTGQFFAGLSVELVMSGNVLQKARSIRALDIQKAIDDQGNDLLKEKEEGSSSSMSMSFGSSGGDEGELRQSLDLKNPARSASAISELSGEVQLYMPDKDPKSRVVIKGFMNHTGKLIVSDALKKAKIQVAVLNREQFEAAQTAQQQAEQGTAPAAKDPASALLKAFPDSFNSYMTVSDGDLVFVVDDPGGRLVDHEVLDASGTAVPTMSTSGNLGMRTISYEQLPDATAQLVLYMETTGSLVRAPFSLTNLTLP